MKDDAFVNFLATQNGKRIFRAKPPGNSGDILLQKGLELHVQAQGHVLVEHASEADIILMHGGGSIDDVWQTGRQLLEQLLSDNPDTHIVVAPSSYHFFQTDFAALLAPYGQHIDLFCREAYSYERLRAMELTPNVAVHLAHDTAFMLKDTAYLRGLQERANARHTLFAMRTNRESRIVSFEWYPHKRNVREFLKHRYIRWEIKRFLRRVCPDAFARADRLLVDASYEDYDTFLELVLDAREVYTDRLHVGILAALLGKPVHLFPTKYDKIQGVYAQSLAAYAAVTPHF